MSQGTTLDAQNAYLVRLLRHGTRENQMPVLQRLKAREAENTRLRRCLTVPPGDGRIAELLTQLDDAQAVIERMRATIQILWSIGGSEILELEAVVQEILTHQPSCS